ncbi:MAG: hypothetical protein C0626_12745 [Arcobacter sp.]|nr:MAG: hypothetical protein C0626_12745 [Arcobacter sp.]
MTFAGIKTSLNKENEKVFYGEELIRKFNNCCVLASPLYASRSKYGFLLEYSFIHEEFHIKANQHVKKNIFINKFIERFSTCIWFKIQAINVNRQSISLGYPKLDNFIKYYQTNKQKTSNIVFMASVYSDITLEYSATETDEFFLDDIVKKYYNQKVIYRPHPFSLSNTIVKGRIHRLNNYNNFYLDDSSSYFDVLSKNQVLISEGFGSSVYMYATATLKPVIFYLPNKDYLNRMEGFYGKNLTVIGDIAETRNELFSLINKHLNDIEYMKKKSRDIELFRNKNISNIGDSKNALIKFLNNYSHLVSKNKLTSFYQDKLVKLSKAKIKTYFDLIKNNKLIIYGAGEHFDNVLQKLYNFRNLNICFTDSNKELWGKEKDGINIISKLDIKSTDYIIISSKKYEQEIYNELRDQYSNIILLYENQEINNEIETIFADYYQIILFWFNIIKIEHFIDQDTLNDILNKDITSFKELSLQCLKASRINFNYTNSLELYFKKDSLYLMKNNYFPKNIE